MFEGESDSRPRGSDPREQVSYGIYKYGQGYWVRVGTAFLLGLLITAFAGWIWKQLELVPVPKPTWQLTVTDADAALAPGAKAELVADLARPTAGATSSAAPRSMRCRSRPTARAA